jgi:hypothetical protein
MTYHDGGEIGGHENEVCFGSNILNCNRPNLCNNYGSDSPCACRNVEALGTHVGWEDLSDVSISFGISKSAMEKYLCSINPGVWPKAYGIAKGEEEDEDNTDII